nr:MAG TPA: hypothetical protein [Caudoviricetes sp.]
MIRGRKIYNKTHTLPKREGFFIAFRVIFA